MLSLQSFPTLVTPPLFHRPPIFYSHSSPILLCCFGWLSVLILCCPSLLQGAPPPQPTPSFFLFSFFLFSLHVGVDDILARCMTLTANWAKAWRSAGGAVTQSSRAWWGHLSHECLFSCVSLSFSILICMYPYFAFHCLFSTYWIPLSPYSFLRLIIFFTCLSTADFWLLQKHKAVIIHRISI